MNRVCPKCEQQTSAEVCPHDGASTLVVAAGPASLVGSIIAKRYEVKAIIGEGGFGAVYKAVHTGTGDLVAIKLLHTAHGSNAEMTARFQQEASVTASLKQPHTVRVFDFGQTDDLALYIAMEFLDGKTLTKVMETESPIGYERAGHMVLQVLKSLSEAHSKGLVHRDLKPDNIFLQTVHGEDDFVKVLDFGIAKLLISGDGGAKTATGVIIGTPPYMSPEQARGSGVDERTDIYALGCIFYQLLTGHCAFAAETAMDTLIRRITEPPPRPHGHCQTPTPDSVCDVVLRAMGTMADQRFASAQEFSKALTKALKDPPLAQIAVHADAGGYDATFAGDHSVIRSAVQPTALGQAAAAAEIPASTGSYAPSETSVIPSVPRPAPRGTVTGAATRPSQNAMRPASQPRPAQATDYNDLNQTSAMDVVSASATLPRPASRPMAAPAVQSRVQSSDRLPAVAAEKSASKAPIWLAAAAGVVVLAGIGVWFAGRGGDVKPKTPAAGAPVQVAAKAPEEPAVPAAKPEQAPAVAAAAAPAPAQLPAQAAAGLPVEATPVAVVEAPPVAAAPVKAPAVAKRPPAAPRGRDTKGKPAGDKPFVLVE